MWGNRKTNKRGTKGKSELSWLFWRRVGSLAREVRADRIGFSERHEVGDAIGSSPHRAVTFATRQFTKHPAGLGHLQRRGARPRRTKHRGRIKPRGVGGPIILGHPEGGGAKSGETVRGREWRRKARHSAHKVGVH